MQKPLTAEYIGATGVKYIFEFYESDTFADLPKDRIKQSYAVAFCGDNFLVVNNIDKPGSYSLIGGSVESDENPNDTLIREIKEESNMKVIDYKLIGYQKVIDTRGIQKPFYQLRYYAVVESCGPFVSDPAGKVTEIIKCDRDNYKKYFDWGEIGDFIIKKAFEIKNKNE